MSQSRLTSPKEFQDLAATSTSPAELDELARKPWNFVWLEVAKNPCAAPETLARLVPQHANGWNEQDLIAALAGNPQTRSEDLGRCARLLGGHLTGGRGETNAFRAGVALACSPSTPFDDILNLLTHPTTCMNFRKVVARESSRPDVLTKLAEDRSARVRAVAQRRRA